jgi:hypothetical protein
MKTRQFLGLFLASVFIISCTKDKCSEVRTFKRWDPIFVTANEYRHDINIAPARQLHNPGKIYFYKQYILINELREGVHIINNSSPANPINEGFIPITGNVDVSVMNDKLYADAYTDLLVVDIQNILQPKLIQRRENTFNSFYHAGPQGILSHYQETDVVQQLDCSDDLSGGNFFFREGGLFMDMVSTAAFSGAANATGAPVVGQGGSMARFTISKNHLYTIGEQEIYAIPIQSDGSVNNSNRVALPWGIETIFPYQDFLFIGARDGMHILGLSNPSSPNHMSTFSHAVACDPVVVQNDIAFVTLRTGNMCAGNNNQLDVIDVSNLMQPRLLHTHRMDNPHGLAVRGNYLYLCEGQHGLKVFDISNLGAIRSNLKAHIKGFDAFDVISISPEILLVIGVDGFRQYKVSNPTQLVLISQIPVIRS